MCSRVRARGTRGSAALACAAASACELAAAHAVAPTTQQRERAWPQQPRPCCRGRRCGSACAAAAWHTTGTEQHMRRQQQAWRGALGAAKTLADGSTHTVFLRLVHQRTHLRDAARADCLMTVTVQRQNVDVKKAAIPTAPPQLFVRRAHTCCSFAWQQRGFAVCAAASTSSSAPRGARHTRALQAMLSSSPRCVRAPTAVTASALLNSRCATPFAFAPCGRRRVATSAGAAAGLGASRRCAFAAGVQVPARVHLTQRARTGECAVCACVRSATCFRLHPPCTRGALMRFALPHGAALCLQPSLRAPWQWRTRGVRSVCRSKSCERCRRSSSAISVHGASFGHSNLCPRLAHARAPA